LNAAIRNALQPNPLADENDWKEVKLKLDGMKWARLALNPLNPEKVQKNIGYKNLN
jgi:hypothetical protein